MTIGIAGASGSGKTTFAKALMAQMPGAALLSMDAYYRDRSHLPLEERATLNFDHPRAIEWELLLEHLTKRQEGRCVDVPGYDFKTYTRRAERQTIAPSASTVLEGLFGLWDSRVRGLLDFSIFVDTPDDVCFERRIARDVADRERMPESVRRQWERDTLPMFRRYTSATRQYADCIVNGAVPPEDEVRRVLHSCALLSPDAV